MCFVIVIMIDGSEKRNCEGGLLNLRVRILVKSAVKMICFKNLILRTFFADVKLGSPAMKYVNRGQAQMLS